VPLSPFHAKGSAQLRSVSEDRRIMLLPYLSPSLKAREASLIRCEWHIALWRIDRGRKGKPIPMGAFHSQGRSHLWVMGGHAYQWGSPQPQNTELRDLRNTWNPLSPPSLADLAHLPPHFLSRPMPLCEVITLHTHSLESPSGTCGRSSAFTARKRRTLRPQPGLRSFGAACRSHSLQRRYHVH
jgi:hypothetical protein